MDQDIDSLFEAISDGVYIHDYKGNFIAVNDSVAKTYGYPKDFFIGKSPADFSAPGMNDLEFVQSLFHKCVTENAPQKLEFWAVCADGSIFPKEVIINPGVFRGKKVVIAIAREISERKRLEENLREQAENDYLTGLYNRRLFDELSRKSLATCLRNKSSLSMLIFDIDHFKLVNDTYGHIVGDLVLQVLAKYALKNLRESDVLARIGGDEFGIILPQTSLHQGLKWADRFRSEVSKMSIHREDGNVSVTISIGVVQIDGNVNNFEELYKTTDAAMYKAKNDGGNCVRYI